MAGESDATKAGNCYIYFLMIMMLIFGSANTII